jgi:hypothetical protein
MGSRYMGNGGAWPGEIIERPGQEWPRAHPGRSDAGASAGTIHHCHGASPDPSLMTGSLQPYYPDVQLIPAESGNIAEGRLGARGILKPERG